MSKEMREAALDTMSKIKADARVAELSIATVQAIALCDIATVLEHMFDLSVKQHLHQR